jgi:tRNA(Ile2) C34 agmatinyltransferase TiaS
MIKDADITMIRTLQHIEAESCTKWYQPFHNAVHKQCSHKKIASFETNQYTLAHIQCAKGNSVTFLDQNKTINVHAEPPKGEE